MTSNLSPCRALTVAFVFTTAAASFACTDDAPSTDAPLPIGEIASIELSPSKVLLTDDNSEQTLEVRAFDAEGEEVQAAGLELDWVRTQGEAIGLTVDDAGHATVTMAGEIGSSVIVARTAEGGDAELITNPVVVQSAVLQDQVVTLADADILFPPPGLREDDALGDYPNIEVSEDGETILVGSFDLAELLEPITQEGADPELSARYPVVIPRSAYVEGMTHVVAEGSAQVVGEVVDHLVRDEWVVLWIAAAEPTDIYAEAHVAFDSDALVAEGLLDPELLAADLGSSDAGEGFRDAPFTDCLSANASLWKVSGLNPTLKPKAIPLVYELLIEDSAVEKFEFSHGWGLEASWRPTIDVRFEGELALQCYVDDPLMFTTGIVSAVTHGLFDFRMELQPRFDASVEIAAGPHLNAYLLRICTTTANYGFRYEDGQWWGADADGQDYWRLDNGCFDGEESWDHNLTMTGLPDGLVNLAPGIEGQDDQSFDHLDLDFLFDMYLGITPEVSAHLQLAAGPVVKLAKWANKSGVGWLEWGMNKILDYTSTKVLRVDPSLGFRGRYEGPLEILTGADQGYWHANEHQVFGVQASLEIWMGIEALNQGLGLLFGKIGGAEPDLGVTIEPPPVDLLPIYLGIEGYGSMSSTVSKGPGNTGYAIEVGDTLSLSVPGVFGSFTFLPPGVFPASFQPFVGEVVWRDSLTNFAHLAWMEPEYVGTSMIFHAEIPVDSQELADYLNYEDPEGTTPSNDRELFFLSYNLMLGETDALTGQTGGIPTAGYLGSKSDFSAIELAVDGVPEAIAEASVVGSLPVEVEVELTNASEFNGEPLPEVGLVDVSAPDWVEVVPGSLAFDALNPSAALEYRLSCPVSAEPETWEGEVELEFALIEEGAPTSSRTYTTSVTLECDVEPPIIDVGPPAFVGTACPELSGEVDYLALDIELGTYHKPELLEFGVKLLGAEGNVCLPPEWVELPVPCDGPLDYKIWKMGGSISFNDFGFLGTPYYVWNAHYLAEGMWEEHFLISAEPVSLLPYAQETDPLVPCNDARGDLVSGPASPIIDPNDKVLEAYPVYQRDAPDTSLPEGFQECYDRVVLYGGNDLVPCSTSTTTGALYMVIEPAVPLQPSLGG